MKKILAVLSVIFLSVSVFAASVNPSLDGRVAVANSNTFPVGGFYGKAPGYLPGDTVVVTNHINGLSVEVLILGSQDASEGVAILLSPEAAEKLQIQSGKDVYVNVQKKQSIPYEKSLATKNSVGSTQTEGDPDKDSNLLPGNTEEMLNSKYAKSYPAIDENVEEETEIAESEISDVEDNENLEEVAEIEDEEIEDALPIEELILPVDDGEEIAEIEELPENEVALDKTDDVEQIVLAETAAESDEEETIALSPIEDDVDDIAEIEEIPELEEVEQVEQTELAEIEDIDENDENIDVTEDVKEEYELADIEMSDENDTIEVILDDESFDEEVAEEVTENEVSEIAELENENEEVEEELAEIPQSTENEEVIIVLEEADPVYPEPVILDENSAKGIFEQLIGEDVEVETKNVNENEVVSEVSDNEGSSVEEVSNNEIASSEDDNSIVDNSTFAGRHRAIIYSNFTDLPLAREVKSETYYVQVSTMANEDGIENVIGKYGEKYPVKLIERNDNSYQVLVGPLNDDEYEVVLARLRGNFKDAFLRIK